jgi:hypothetical protein
MMLDELQRRNYSQNTVYTYLHAVPGQRARQVAGRAFG